MAASHCSSGPGRCRECICGIETNDEIWCARLKRVPDDEEAKRCQRFCPKALLDE